MTMTEGSIETGRTTVIMPERVSRRRLAAAGILGFLATGLVSYGAGRIHGQEGERARHCPPYTESLQLAPGMPQVLDDSVTPAKDDILLTFESGRLKVDGPAVIDGREMRPLNGDGSSGVITIETASNRLPTQFDFVRDGNVMRVTFIANPNCQ